MILVDLLNPPLNHLIFNELRITLTYMQKNRKCDIPSSERLITTIINNPKLLTMFGNPKRLNMICDLSLNNFPLHYIMLDESELKTLQTIYREMK